MTDAELASALHDYRRDGYAVLPVRTDPAALRERFEELVTGRRPDPGLFFQPDTPTGRYDDLAFGHGWAGAETNYRKVEKLERDPEFHAWLTQPLFERVVRAVLPGEVRLYRATVFHKAAGVGSDLPWHQDGGRFWGLSRDPELQVWTAMDDAPPEAGALEVVPGSHLAGLVTPMGGLVPAHRWVEAEGRVVSVPAVAGQVVLLHNLVWHRSGPNRTAAARRGFTACYLHGDTRCTRTRRAPREFPVVFAG